MARQVIRLADYRHQNKMMMICEGMVSTSSAENQMLFEEYGDEDQRSLGQILQDEIDEQGKVDGQMFEESKHEDCDLSDKQNN